MTPGVPATAACRHSSAAAVAVICSEAPMILGSTGNQCANSRLAANESKTVLNPGSHPPSGHHGSVGCQKGG